MPLPKLPVLLAALSLAGVSAATSYGQMFGPQNARGGRGWSGGGMQPMFPNPLRTRTRSDVGTRLPPPPPPAPRPPIINPTPWTGGGGGAWHGGDSGWVGGGSPGADGFRGAFERGGAGVDGTWGSVSSAGLTVGGVYTSDNFNLAFRVGGPGLICPPVRPGWCFPNWCSTYPLYPSYGYGYGFGGYYPYYGGYSSYSYPIDGFYSYSDPTLQPGYTPPAQPAPQVQEPSMAPPPPATVRDVADSLLASGKAKEAAKQYERHLTAEPGDTFAMRSLALALMESGQLKEGVAMMGMAYRSDPSLCARPILPMVLPDGDKEFRRLVIKASTFANRINSGSAWLTVAVLMQAEGRDEAGKAVMAKADKAGLDDELVRKMYSALGR